MSEVNTGRLNSLVQRIERLEEDKAAISADIKEVYAEAKGDGYEVKALRKLIRIRKTDRAKRQEEAAIVELYAASIGEVLP
jgi:uncharacterized protein (UPF0335 family)